MTSEKDTFLEDPKVKSIIILMPNKRLSSTFLFTFIQGIKIFENQDLGRAIPGEKVSHIYCLWSEIVQCKRDVD